MSVRKRYQSRSRTRHIIFFWLRIILGLFVSISLVIFGYIWTLSAGHIAPGEWSIILPIAFAVLGVVLAIFQWLFPFSPDSEERTTNGVTLMNASELRHENFNLGDDSAATFHYIVEPVQEAYHSATQLLHNIRSDTQVSKQGFLIIGESNAGKTRLALEALTVILPEWSVLQWNSSYSLQDIPDSQSIAKKDIVIFIDDIQKYVSVESILYARTDLSTIKAEIIHVLISRLREDAKQVRVIATCREEDEIKARAKMNHFFESLQIIRIKRFNPDPHSDEAKSIIMQFENKGAKHSKDWDGTIGSLILGLSRKKSLYDNLVLYNDLGAILLKAMKLLTLAGITTHTDRRLKAVSAEVFGAKELLQDEKIWRTVVERLKQLQFINLDVHNGLIVLFIRKDTYFEKIITDYNRDQAEKDFATLQQVLKELGDTKALCSLGIVYLKLEWHKEAVSLANDAIRLNSSDASLWTLKGLPYMVIGGLDRPLEALAAFNKALNLEPDDVSALLFRGITHGALGQYEEALSDLDCALALDLDNATARAFKGLTLEELGRSQEALVILDQALELDSTNSDTWCNKARALRSLKRLDESLVAFDQALECEPANADIWNDKAFTLKDLNRLEEAFVAFKRSLELDANSVITWHGKAKVAIELEKIEEAQIALDKALTLSSNDIGILHDKGYVLMLLERCEEAVLVWNHLIELDSKQVDAWHFLGVALGSLRRYQEAIAALDKALGLDLNDADIWFNKGMALGIQKQYDEALLALGHALALDPDNADIWFFKGSVHNMLKDNEGALNALNRAIDLNPDKADVFEPFKKALVPFKHKEYIDG